MKFTSEELRFITEGRLNNISWEKLDSLFAKRFGYRCPRKTMARHIAAIQKNRKGKSHLVIADTQVKPGVDISHLYALNRLIRDRKPDVIVHIGDHWDFESLCSYDGKGTLKVEGRRVKADIEAGNRAMDIITANLDYKPELHFLFGNHEYRLERYVDSNPQLDGFLGYGELNLTGWTTHPFLTIAKIDGVHYSHYFANPLTGRPWGGMITTMLKNIGYSFTMGHRQELAYGRKDLTNGGVCHGLVAGAFYMHDEEYKGPQGNHHWRGLIYKHSVSEGDYDIEIISLDRVLKLYGV